MAKQTRQDMNLGDEASGSSNPANRSRLGPLTAKSAAALFVAIAFFIAVLWVGRDLPEQPFVWESVPASFGAWTSRDAAVTDLEIRILVTDQIFGRRYTGPEGEFFVSVVYYPTGKVNFHHPEGCTRSKGSELRERQSLPLSGAWRNSEGTYFQIVEPSGRIIHYAYAFCTPYAAHGQYVRFRKHLALTSLRNGRTACALIRISMATHGQDENARQKLQDFWERMSPHFLEAFQGGGNRMAFHDKGS